MASGRGHSLEGRFCFMAMGGLDFADLLLDWGGLSESMGIYGVEGMRLRKGWLSVRLCLG